MSVHHATITALGHYTPPKILSNFDLEKMVDTNDEWIRTRTGIRERRVMETGASSDMAALAIQNMVERYGVNVAEIEVIIVATVTPDMFFPATAVLVGHKVGAKQAWGFDVSAACSGFLYALATGAKFIESGANKKVLVVGVDKMSSIIDYTDRNTCILFGDAAACVLLEPTDEAGYGLRDHRLYSDGAGGEFLNMKAGGSLNPASHETVDKKMHFIYQDGKNVFKLAVKGMADVSAEVMERNGLKSDDVAWLVPHQANLRIIDATASRMGIDNSKVMINIDRYGNTTAATIPLCLSEWVAAGKLLRGQNIILAAFGAGYTWGAAYIKWSLKKIA
jgi:3-oxoacyl-[acyl-carrier-protein] synthase-3